MNNAGYVNELREALATLRRLARETGTLAEWDALNIASAMVASSYRREGLALSAECDGWFSLETQNE